MKKQSKRKNSQDWENPECTNCPKKEVIENPAEGIIRLQICPVDCQVVISSWGKNPKAKSKDVN